VKDNLPTRLCGRRSPREVGISSTSLVRSTVNDAGTRYSGSTGKYVSGGKVYFLDGTSTYAGGEITMTSGPNVGRSMEIKDSQVGMLTLQLPFGRLCTVGDTATLTIGCDKTRPTCRNKFSNVRNFGGFPDVPGRDKVIQVGRPQ